MKSRITAGGNVIGVDLGGTKIRAVRYGIPSPRRRSPRILSGPLAGSSTWDVEDDRMMPTHAEQKFSHVFEDMLRLIGELRTEDTRSVGVGVPGLVRQSSGVILRLPNVPGAEGFPLLERLRGELKLPVFVENDANCFALAEALQGAGKDHDIVIGITMGTGVGGGIVVRGELFRGEHGFAAEIGHMLLQPGQPPFATEDRRGEVEQFFSGVSMGKRCEEAQDPKDYLEGKICAFMHKSVFREVAWLCTNLAHLLDPGIILFGGSAGLALRPHLPEVKEELVRWMLPGAILPELAIAELPDAPTRGAAILALRKVA